MTGAQALVAALEAEGVEVVFGLPGVHNLAIWEALGPSPIRLVGVRHEQAAAYAADGYARATGRPGVALVTTGPGAANTLGAVGEAFASRSPVVVIATEVPTELAREGRARTSLHGGVDQIAMFTPVTKHAASAHHGYRLDLMGREMLHLAAEAPARPVYLGVPADLLRIEGTSVDPSSLLAEPAVALPRRREPERALALLRAARRPLVWAGGGALQGNAGDAVAALAARLGAPAFETYAARGLLTGSPSAVGLPPHVPEAGALWDAADLVLSVGSDLDGMTTQNWRQPKPDRHVAVNVDPGDATRGYGADAVLVLDAQAGCQALLGGLEAPDREPWADLPALRERAWARLRAEHPEETAFLDAFTAALPDGAIVLADMCIPGYWLAGLGEVAAPRRLQYPMGWGTLGFAFAASLGAACAGAGPVISVSGDGGFLFACGELATAAQERLPLTTVIVDDGGYGMLRFDQRRSGAQQTGVDLRTPDFAALGRSFGLRADAVDGLGEAFATALADHAADPEPTVLVARAALQPPPTTSPRWYRAAAPTA
jgi:thiamine pyrophosphate-dependent acetolactate synthase large subunit-like protein